MSYTTRTYYSKNSQGKIIQWFGKITDAGVMIITTGQIGSSRDIINSSIEPKNVGKANSTSKYQQAIKELKAKARKKAKNGYKTLEDLGNDVYTLDLEGHRLLEVLDTRLAINKTDSNNVLKPMKAVQWEKAKRNYPMICQPKINGHRNTAMLVKDIEGMFATNETRVKLLTKSGHEYILPHISNSMPIEWFDGNTVFDGEVYVHNEVLSNIKRRLPLSKDGGKPSNNSLPSDIVQFMIFDLSIPEVNQVERLDIKDKLLNTCIQLYYDGKVNKYITTIPYSKNNGEETNINIVNVMATVIHSDEEAYKHLQAALDSGYEGIILRDLDAEYRFGGRGINMIKLKSLKNSEFEIVDIILKNKDSVRTYVDYVLKNDINDLTFETPVQGDEYDRSEALENVDNYIGKKVTLGFGERTIKGLPFHIKTVNIRDEFDMDKTDLQIEI